MPARWTAWILASERSVHFCVYPCPCGHFGDSGCECLCSPVQIARYLGCVSGPRLDRIDLHVEAARVKPDDLTAGSPAKRSTDLLVHVLRARAVQREQFGTSGVVQRRDVALADPAMVPAR